MGQKVNPVLLRLQSSNRHFDNFWYSNHFYAELLSKDLFVKQYLNTFFKLLKLPSTRLSIQHSQKRTKIYTFFCYPKQSRDLRSKFFQIPSTFLSFQGKIRNENKKYKDLFTKNCLNDFVLWSNYKNKKNLTHFNSRSLLSIYFSKKKDLLFHSPTPVQNELLEKNLFFLKKTFPQSNYLFSTKNLDNLNKNILKKLTINLLFNKVKELRNKDFFTLSNRNLISKKQQFLKFFILLYSIFIKYNKNTSILTNYSKLTYPIRSFQYFFPKFSCEKSTFSLNEKQNSVQLKSDRLDSSFLLPISNIPNILEKELKYKNYIEGFLSSKYKMNFDYIPFKIDQDWQHAGFLADEIVYFLERRIPFRRIKTRILKQISENLAIRGVRITCSGRVGGKSKKAQRAKVECVKYGQTSLHVFTSQIDYAVRTAHTSFGSVGIKVWICYN